MCAGEPRSLVMLTVTPCRVLPQFARVVSAAIDAPPPASVRLPDRLLAAPLDRRQEFLAGRHCAAEALRLLGSSEWTAEIATGPGGEPLWPAGYVGSITHANGVAAAAVAPRSRADALGLGVEVIDHPERMVRLSRVVQHACETRLKARGFDPLTVFILGLSAKKSLFKCLYPLVCRRFDYRDVAVRNIDVSAHAVEMELLTSLAPGFHRGRRFVGQFHAEFGVISTGFCLGTVAP